MGRPKALVADEGGPWLPRAARALRDAGCDEVVVVLGAEAETARALVPSGVDVVVADGWAEGMGASLRAGLSAARRADLVLVLLVDLPDVGAEVCRRLLASGSRLARASYDGVPGHPVLIGGEHVAGVLKVASGDRGARDYLAAHPHDLVECGDLATGVDVDTPR